MTDLSKLRELAKAATARVKDTYPDEKWLTYNDLYDKDDHYEEIALYLEAVDPAEILSLLDEVERLRKALINVIESEHHVMGTESKAVKIAREALKEGE